MRIYIVSTVRSTSTNITGYRLVDLDDKYRTMTIKKDSLATAMYNKSIKIENAQLIERGILGIRGKKYSLEKLSYFNCADGQYVQNGVLMLSATVGLVADKDTIRVNSINRDSLIAAIKSGKVINDAEVIEWLSVNQKLVSMNTNVVVNDSIEKSAENSEEIWDIGKFEEYMKRHNWRYEIVEVEYSGKNVKCLRNVDENCEVLHMPMGIEITGVLFKRAPRMLKTLIISNTVKYFDTLYTNRGNDEVVRINRVVIQHRANGIESYDLGLNGLNITEELIFPDVLFEGIINIFNNSVINKVNMGGGARLFQESFNHTKGIGNAASGLKAMQIKESFSQSDIKQVQIIGLLELSGSFNNCEIITVDLTQSQKLSYMVNSFNNNIGLRELKLYTINHKYFINLVDNTMEKGGFYNCPLDFLHIERISGASALSVKGLGNNNTLVFGKEVTEDCGSIFNLIITNNQKPKIIIEAEHIRLKELFTVLYMYQTNDPEKIEIREKISSVAPRAFVAPEAYNFDTMVFPNWHDIEPATFYGYGVRTLIINKNIEHISEYAMQECVTIQNIILDDTNIADTLKLNMFKQSRAVRVFVLRGSKAATAFSKWTKHFMVTEVDSIEEAKNIVFTELGKDNIAKYKVILTGTPDEWLVDDKYKNNISFLYKMISNSRKNIPGHELELDTSKFKEVDGRMVKYLHKDLSGVDKYSVPEGYKHSNRFVALSNLITKLFKPSMYAYNERLLNHLDCVGWATSAKIIYTDELNNNIYQINITEVQNSLRYSLLVIEEFGIIKYVCDVMMYNYYLENTIGEADPMLTGAYNIRFRQPITEYSITHLLKQGDRVYTDQFSTGNVISSVSIPGMVDFTKAANPRMIINDTWLMIGFKRETKIMSKRTVKVLFYDLISQQLIETSVENGSSDAISLKVSVAQRVEHKNVSKLGFIDQVLIEKVHEFEELSTLDKEYFDTLKGYYNSGMRFEILADIIKPKEEKEKILMNRDNYDIGENKKICDFAEYVMNTITSETELKQFPQTIKQYLALIESGILRKSSENLKGLEKKEGKYVCNERHKITNNLGKEIEYIEYGPSIGLKNGNGFKDYRPYFVGIITPLGKTRNKTELFECSIQPSKLLRVMREIAKNRRSNTSGQILDRVTNKPIYRERFIVIKKDLIEYGDREPYNVYIGVEKQGGNVFVLSSYDEQDVYTFLRFKDICTAFDFLQVSIGEGQGEYNTVAIAEVMNSEVDTIELKNSEIGRIRIAITDGLPDGAPLYKVTCLTKYKTMMSQISKQPKADIAKKFGINT